MLIEGNVFFNGAGIILWTNGTTTIFRNIIVNCTDRIALNEHYGYDTTVYYNDFINDNYTVIYAEPNAEIPWHGKWDNCTVGNYWSDYSPSTLTLWNVVTQASGIHPTS